MLNKEVCKRCHEENMNPKFLKWAEFEKDWDENKRVFCQHPVKNRGVYGCMTIKRIVIGCPYILEQMVMGNKNVK